MLADYLIKFNETLLLFQEKFPNKKWSQSFKNSLINDYVFFSSRIEDSKLQYGDTIRFLNNETIRGVNFSSLYRVSEHQIILKNILEDLQNFELSEELIKKIHKNLMSRNFAWDSDFKPELVGNYRNIPTIGSREPYFKNKEYAPHYNLEIIMSTYLELFRNKFDDIDNENFEKHILSRIAFFHNKFLNQIHPFADGNGRVCRIIIGAILMKNNCPPIFPEIITQEQQVEYINTIVICENKDNDQQLVEYLAKGITKYMRKKLNNNESSN